MRFYYETSFPTLHVQRDELSSLPIILPDRSSSQQRVLYDRMNTLVRQMLQLHKHLTAKRTSHERVAIQRQIEATDRQIDRLVYELYGLTVEEIQLVEESIR
jgi:hypothetical protein